MMRLLTANKVALAVIACLGAALLVPGTIVRKFTFKDGSTARISMATTWRARGGLAGTTILCRSVAGKPVSVVLWQDAIMRPLVVVPDSSANILLCLYEDDTALRLMRIDPNEPYKPPLTNSFLSRIVCSASCRVTGGSRVDWDAVYTRLKSANATEFGRLSLPAISIGLFRVPLSRSLFLDRLETGTSFLGGEEQ